MTKPCSSDDLQSRTISNFGHQWTTYTDNSGYYGSKDLLADMIQPLLAVEDLAGKRVAEIGSGTGRIVNMLLAAEVASVVAVEPSDAIQVLEHNTAHAGERVKLCHCLGDQIEPGQDLDYVVSIGVLHHIPQPDATVQAVRQALKPGGKFLVWLYGKEGNGAYLSLVLPLRALTSRLPHWLLVGLSHALTVILGGYIALCRIASALPLAGYMRNVIGHFSYAKRYLVVYDQLCPAYAKYYTRAEAVGLLQHNGFTDVQVHHRHGYSWTVIGTAPGAA
jgi:SAM-dependent methyltransferase